MKQWERDFLIFVDVILHILYILSVVIEILVCICNFIAGVPIAAHIGHSSTG